MTHFISMDLPKEKDVAAPDGSEIRFLPVLKGGSMVHCRLNSGSVTKAVRHKTVEEIWFIINGSGELWRRQEGGEEVVPLLPGTAHTIPLGTEFQFRAAPNTDLEFIIVTMPPWPNMAEAEPVSDHWPPTKSNLE